MEQDSNEMMKEIGLVYVHHSIYSKDDWHSTMHTHYFSELLYILKGEGYLMVNGQKILLTKGKIVVVNPYILHTEVSNEDNPLEYIVIGMDNLRFELDNSEQNCFELMDSTGVLNPVNQLIMREIKQKNRGQEVMLKNLSEVFLIELLRMEHFQLKKPEGHRISKDGAIIKEYIERHYKEEINLDSLSRHLHLDKFYIIHTFKKNFNDTPMNYLMKKRLTQAKELLLNTDYTIYEITQILGFNSQSYFNQAFKKEYYTSPGKFRKQKAN